MISWVTSPTARTTSGKGNLRTDCMVHLAGEDCEVSRAARKSPPDRAPVPHCQEHSSRAEHPS